MQGPVAPNPKNPGNNVNANADQNNDNNDNNDNNVPAGPPNRPPQQLPNQPAPQQPPPQQPALQQPAPQQPAPANPAGPFQPALNWPQPFPQQSAPWIIHQQMINCCYFKPEFAGKSEEDAEAHLLRTNDWMRTHNFEEDVNVQRFCLTL